MTRKDFETIAKIIKNIKDNIDPNLMMTNIYFKDMVDNLSDYFKQSNSAFDKERFMKACGYEEP